MLIVLDNFESPWEAQRKQVEGVLGRLVALGNLTLVITMRGTERPRNIKWDELSDCKHRELSALDRYSARSLFLEISKHDGYSAGGDSDDPDDLDKLIDACDYIPLPITLMAQLIGDGLETVPALLQRRQKMLPLLVIDDSSDDPLDNMTVSIQLSINSHRIQSHPGSLVLLYIIAMLPDGILDEHLDAAARHIQDFDQSKRALLRTSLIYRGENCNRFRMHSLIRSYAIANLSGGSINAIRALATDFWDMLKRAWKDEHVVASEGNLCAAGVRVVKSELGNIESLTRYILTEKIHDHDTIEAAFEAAVAIACLYFQTSLGTFALLADFQVDIEKHGNKKLLADSLYWTAIASVRFHTNVKGLLQKARPSFQFEKALKLYGELGDESGRAECYRQLASVAFVARRFDENLSLLEEAMKVHCNTGNRERQVSTHTLPSSVRFMMLIRYSTGGNVGIDGTSSSCYRKI